MTISPYIWDNVLSALLPFPLSPYTISYMSRCTSALVEFCRARLCPKRWKPYYIQLKQFRGLARKTTYSFAVCEGPPHVSCTEWLSMWCSYACSVHILSISWQRLFLQHQLSFSCRWMRLRCKWPRGIGEDIDIVCHQQSCMGVTDTSVHPVLIVVEVIFLWRTGFHLRPICTCQWPFLDQFAAQIKLMVYLPSFWCWSLSWLAQLLSWAPGLPCPKVDANNVVTGCTALQKRFGRVGSAS